MIKFIWLIALFLSVNSQTLIAYSDISTTILLDPKGKTLVHPIFFTSKNPNPLNNGANVVYMDGPDTWPSGTKTTFQNQFYTNCPMAIATLTIFADDYFTVYLNGISIFSGNNCQTYTIKINLECGLNTLTTIVTNLGGPGGYLFAITQNQTDCYQCGYLSHYEFMSCQCICQVPESYFCSNPLKKWTEYPVCGCKCMNRPMNGCNLVNQYFSEKTCLCECKPVVCLANLEQDPQSCQCRCKAQACVKPQKWSYTRCACIN